MKKRNKFSLSHHNILSCRMGQLIPIACTEVLPGDTIQQSTTGLLRCAPLGSPLMARVDARIHHYFVPWRIIWNGWEPFITGGPDGDNNLVVPYYQLSNPVQEGSLLDYLGVPTGISGLRVNCLPVRAYNLIWNEFYRDEDLMPEASISLESGEDSGVDGTGTPAVLKNICWEKDYFTSARPWTQKGSEVTIPVDATGDMSITADGDMQFVPGTAAGLVSGFTAFANSATGKWRTNNELSGSNSPTYSNIFYQGANASGAPYTGSNLLRYQSGLKINGLTADSGGGIGSINIDDLRLALSLQRFQEARSRFGSRYVEYLRYLGVVSSDARLQRPEYLGGGRSPLQFSEVLQTAEGTDPVGTMRGHGITAVRSNRYRRFFEEHGVVMSLLSIRPKTVYTNMLPRMFIRRTKEDFWQPELQHIGQQEVYNKELNANSSNPDGVFGYQDRYAEYRYHESSVHGEFRSTLNYWHMARDIAGNFSLNGDFVRCNPTTRVFAAPGTPQEPNDTVYCFFNHSIQARRLVSANATPRIF